MQILLQQKIREAGDTGGGQEVGFDGLGKGAGDGGHFVWMVLAVTAWI